MSLALCLLLIVDYFRQIPLVNEPELTIWRFNKAGPTNTLARTRTFLKIGRQNLGTFRPRTSLP
ncbi:MAG: hypothetical protein ABIM74_00760 [candidate division WOR-3 bacterium]